MTSTHLGRRRARRRPVIATVIATVTAVAILSSASCGLPGGGSVTRVDDGTVPYHLLEPATPSEKPSTRAPESRRVPVVFWLANDRLVPQPADNSCDEQPELLVERLLEALGAGPPEAARAIGRSSAIPPESGLELVSLVGGTATVDIEPETSLSAERLPAAVGQVVLTVTSVPTVRSVYLISDGEPAQVPLPGGALTDGSVTADDYIDLVPRRYQRSPSLGCPRHQSQRSS